MNGKIGLFNTKRLELRSRQVAEDSIKVIISLLLLITLNSCITSEKLKRENPYELLDFSISNLEGTYSNKIEGGSCEGFGLWNLLIRSYNKSADSVNVNNEMFVKLKMISADSLNVKLIDNNSTISEFTVKGKIDSEYFSIKKKYFLLPIPLIYLRFETKNMLGNASDRDLVLMHGYKREGWILIFAGGGGGISENKFRRIN